MAGQAANLSVKEVKSAITGIECNKQMTPGSTHSGAETNKQLGKSGSMQKKSK
jgi:hypothetical protein